MCVRSYCVIVLALFILFSNSVVASELPDKINDSILQSEAFTNFENENYSLALPIFEKLQVLYPKEAEYNYYLGICQLKMNTSLEKSIVNLKIALEANVNDVLTFSLAEAYHLTFQFDLAIRYYLKFKEIHKGKIKGVDKNIEMCRHGLAIVNTYSNILLNSNTEVDVNRFYNYYKLSGFSDIITKEKDSIKSNLMCSDFLGEYEYFTGISDNPNNGLDIFRKKKNADMSTRELLKGVNSSYDEAYPFMSVDGKTLFFSSKGFDSMGGYDIFKSEYNTESNTWSKPLNMGFPINSTHDDLFFALDSTGKTACFTSSRETIKGKLMVYNLSYESCTDKRTVQNYENIVDLSNISKLINAEEDKFSLGKFEFELSNTIIYTDLNDFKSQEAKKVFVQAKKDQFESEKIFEEVNKLREKLIFLDKEEEQSVSDQIASLDQISLKLNNKVEAQFEKALELECKFYPNIISNTQSISDSYNSNNTIKNNYKKKVPSDSIFSNVDLIADNHDIDKNEIIPVKKNNIDTTKVDIGKSYSSDSMKNINSNDDSLEGVYYNVYLGDFERSKFNDISKGLINIIIYKQDKGLNSYYLGPYATYEIASKSYFNVKDKFVNSNITPFKNSKALVIPSIAELDEDDEFASEKSILTKTKQSVDNKMMKLLSDNKIKNIIVPDSTSVINTHENKVKPLLNKTINTTDSVSVINKIVDGKDSVSKNIYPIFKVQVAVFSGKVPVYVEQKLHNFNDYKVEYLSVYNLGRTVCNVGNLPSYKLASNLKLKLKSAGFKGAFTVAYLNEKQISVAKAIKMMSFN